MYKYFLEIILITLQLGRTIFYTYVKNLSFTNKSLFQHH
jgi:hypothetical protein